MAKQLTEEELNIRRKARRRLIGAAALALAVVVFLPMVLDSEPKPGGQDIELSIPNADKVGDFVPGIAPSAVNEMTSLDEPVVEPSRPEVSAAAASSVQPAETVPPVRKPEAAVAKPVSAAPIQAAKPTVSKPVVPASDTYIVQVGAFSNAGTARQETDKLNAAGFKAYTEQVSGTTRVRLGPYAERGKADEVRQSLEKRGYKPVVTAVK